MSIIEKAAARLAEKQRKNQVALEESAAGEEALVAPSGTPEPEAGARPIQDLGEVAQEVSTSANTLPGETASQAVATRPGQAEAGQESEEPSTGKQEERGGILSPEGSSIATGSGGGEETASGGVSSVGSKTSTTTSERDTASVIPITQLDPDLVLSPEGGRDRLAEEFRLIKRPLVTRALNQRERAERHSNLIMVTSSLQAEGKSFVSLNLAISIAMEMDSTVLLVDADVAKPGLSRYLGIADRPGLIDRLVDDKRDLAYLLQRTDIPKLTVLPAGSRHKRSTELLASNKMRQLLDEMASRYADRIVLFDSPPLLESTEAGVLAAQMGQVVFVVASEATSQILVKEALTAFDHLDNVSVVLNKVKGGMLSGKYGYAYGYGYGYGSYGEAQE